MVDDAARSSLEATNLHEMGQSVLPLLEKAFDTSASLIYRFDGQGRIEHVAGTQVLANYEYMEEHYRHDPMQRVLRQCNPWLFHASRYPEWQEMIRLPVYEFSLHQGIDDYIFLRLTDTEHDAPGMAGILLARAQCQPAYNEREEFLLAKLLPSLTALTRRSLRLEECLQAQPYVESMLETRAPYRVALDMNGRLIWASEPALTAMGASGSPSIPGDLVHAAKRLCGIDAKKARQAPHRSSLLISRPYASPIRADLSLARTRSGATFLIVELDLPGLSPQVREAADRFRLSTAETNVLGWLARGFADREIGKKLFISHATVRSHVGQILAKMGVSSRVQAALLANGLPAESAENENITSDLGDSPFR